MIKYNKKKYSVLNKDCIGRDCLQLGEYESRGATLSGSRNTGNVSYTCMRRAYHGCPYPLPEYDQDIATHNKKLGMKNL